MAVPGRVVIDCFAERLPLYGPNYAVVAVDVIRATTTAVTALATGRRCRPVPSLEAACRDSRALPDALLAGELGGEVPPGFDMDNSPAAVAERRDVERPIVLLSTSGTRLLSGGAPGQVVYAAS